MKQKSDDKKYPYGEILSKGDTRAFLTALALVVRDKQTKKK